MVVLLSICISFRRSHGRILHHDLFFTLADINLHPGVTIRISTTITGVIIRISWPDHLPGHPAGVYRHVPVPFVTTTNTDTCPVRFKSYYYYYDDSKREEPLKGYKAGIKLASRANVCQNAKIHIFVTF